MDMTPQEYQAYIKEKQDTSPLLKNVALAFAVGGLICVLGQLISSAWTSLGLEKEDAAAATSVSLVFLSAVLTALGLYHRLARFAGAGTLVPITGFANSVVSPAIDFRAEGVITGTAVKMFTIAGPVIVFGTAASALYGLILWLIDVL
jgi:stage V sporulation protein AC